MISRRTKWIGIISGIAAIYHIFIVSNVFAWFGVFIPTAQHRAFSLSFVLLITFLLFSIKGKQYDGNMRWHDVLFLAAGLIGSLYTAFFYKSVEAYSLYGYLDVPGQLLAALLMIALLEGVRRATGWVLPILIAVLLALASFQSILPGFLNGASYPFDQLSYAVYAGSGGIFGLTLGVASTIIITYLIFAKMFEFSGAGEWFVNLASALTGRSTGGPAKASVVGSAFFGMISGSASGNTASTGTFTIPLMKKVGFSPAFAGGVEAVASAGGQILPPVMGTVAFIMAEWIGISYAEVVKYALIPAILYFMILFFSVHFRAKKLNMTPTSKDDIPNVWATFLQGWYYLLPIAALLWLLFSSVGANKPELAALFSLPVLVAVSFLSKKKEHWLTPKRIWESLAAASQSWVVVAVIMASVGMLVGTLDISGLGFKLSSFLVLLGDGNVLITLILVALASLLLGMGMEISASYITLAALAAPVIMNLGLSDVQAHLYIIYWGVASFITPPVCITVYVASGISGSKLWETGWEAMKIGVGVYLVPFAFALNEALLLQGNWSSIAISFVTALAGAVLVSSALQGYGFTAINPLERVLFGIAGLLFIGPGVLNAAIAAGIVAVSLLLQLLRTHIKKKPDRVLKA